MNSLTKVNLAAGDCRFGNGWINIDVRWPHVNDGPYLSVIANFRSGIPLLSSSADILYASHYLEHLDPFDECLRFLDECYRVLKPNGILRLSVPDLRKIARLYLNGPQEYFREYGYTKPWFKTSESWSRRLGISMMHDHKMIYDFESLSEVLRNSSFRDVTEVILPEHGKLPSKAASEIVATHLTHSLIVDAIK